MGNFSTYMHSPSGLVCSLVVTLGLAAKIERLEARRSPWPLLSMSCSLDVRLEGGEIREGCSLIPS